MKDLIALTKEEALIVNGGGLREIGYALGKAAANTVDFVEGFAEGIIKAFEE